MKQKRILWAIVAILGLGFTACDKYEPVPEGSNVLTSAEADELSPMMSIADFKATFDKKDTLFSINKIETESDLYIRGRVVTTDESGNIYKYLVMQDTETGDALKVSIDAGSLSGAIPMGQEIVINCKGLVLGRYADMAQLGVDAFNDEKLRVEPGRIPYPYFMERMYYVGTPDVSKIIVREMTLAELNAGINDSTLYGQLVRIRNVHFTGLGDEGEKLKEADKIFAPSTFNGTYNVGYPQARQIADAKGNVAYISTSEYARFAEMRIPESDDWGDVVAIIGYYKDKADRAGELQLTIRTLADLEGFFDGAGGGGETPDPDPDPEPNPNPGDNSQENPYTVATAIAQNNSGASVWVKGYIVGQVGGKSLSDAEFDAPFNVAEGSTQGTNVLVADDATTASTDVCMPVQLPSGAVRNALNLPDHPEMDGKEVLLYGELVKYFGANGLKNVSCAIVDGVVYGNIPVDTEGAILDVKFTDGLGGFTTYNVLGAQEWSSDSKYGAKMSGYADGASNANEDWLISPTLDLSGKSSVAITFEHAINKGDLNNLQSNHTLWVSTNYNGGDPATATWEQVTITTYPDGKSWTYVSSDEIAVPTAYLTSNVRIAFKYLCSNSESATWEIKNLVIK